MRIKIEQIQSIITDAVQIGYMEAIKAYEPYTDELKEKEAQRWCKATFGTWANIKSLMRAGLIKGHRRGDFKNCAIYYSKADIKKALLAQRLSQIIADDELGMTDAR